MKDNVVKLINDFNASNNNIGEIDYYFWSLNSYEALYYFYPLMERLIINIVAKESRRNVEVYNQERLKTANSVLSNNTIISQHITDKLIDIFKDDGLRNSIMHGKRVVNNNKLLKHLCDVKCLTLILMKYYIREN